VAAKRRVFSAPVFFESAFEIQLDRLLFICYITPVKFSLAEPLLFILQEIARSLIFLLIILEVRRRFCS